MNIAEGVQLVTFAILALMMIGSALGVVLMPKIVYSAFLLGAVFISVAGLYLLLNASFVAAAQILIYVGAVNVLVIFAIMLVNKRQDFRPLPNAFLRQLVTAAVCLGLFLLLGVTALTTPWEISSAVATGDGAILTIGQHFFSDFLLPFELASILLLMALIGAIVLARRDLIPDHPLEAGMEPPDLMLPERSRELVPLGSGRETSA